MTIRQNLIAGATILGLLVTVSTAHAQTTDATKPAVTSGTTSTLPDTFKSLNLTPDQEAKIKPLMEKFMSDLGGILTPDQQAKLKAQMMPSTETPVRRGAGARNNPFTTAADQLALTPDQKAKITPIFQDTQAQLRTLRQDQSMSRQDKAAKTRSILADMKAKVRVLLTPEQQTKLDAMTFQGRGNNNRRNPAGGAMNPGAASPDL